MDRIEWHVSVPIFRNTLILQQLGFAIGIPFGLVAIVVVLVSGQSVYALYGLFLIVLLLFLSWLFVISLSFTSQWRRRRSSALCSVSASTIIETFIFVLWRVV